MASKSNEHKNVTSTPAPAPKQIMIRKIEQKSKNMPSNKTASEPSQQDQAGEIFSQGIEAAINDLQNSMDPKDPNAAKEAAPAPVQT